MFQIVILILRIVGIILLILLGALLLMFLAVLLIPVRYRLSARREQDLYADGQISWLLHLIHLGITRKDKKTHIRLRIAGIKIYDNLRHPGKNKGKNKSKKIKIRNRNSQRKKRINTEENTRLKNVPERIADGSRQVQKIHLEENHKIKSEKKEHDKIRENLQSKDTLDNQDTETKETAVKPSRFSALWSNLLSKIRKIKERIISFYAKCKNIRKRLLQLAADMRRKGCLIKDFLQEEINRQGFQITWESLQKIMRHMRPTKLEASVIFGTGNPCTTGQALGVVAMLYGFYGDRIKITPDFENKRFEGSLEARGRIRLVTLFIIVIKLILDRRFKQLRRNMKTVKEAL